MPSLKRSAGKASGSLTVRVNQLSFARDKQENLGRILTLIGESGAQLDVFPEYCMGLPEGGLGRGFVQENAEPIEGEFVTKIAGATRQRNSAAVFTVFLKEGDAVANAAVLVKAGRVECVYRKIHLFDAFGYRESDMFAPGSALAIAEIGPFKVGLAVCFDLRFPEIFRIMARKGVDLFIVPAGWYAGDHKVEQWQALTSARAHENVSFLAAADQAGPAFAGHSVAVSPLAERAKELGDSEGSFCVTLAAGDVDAARRTVPVLSLAKAALYRSLDS